MSALRVVFSQRLAFSQRHFQSFQAVRQERAAIVESIGHSRRFDSFETRTHDSEAQRLTFDGDERPYRRGGQGKFGGSEVRA